MQELDAKNQLLAVQTLEIIETLIEAGNYMHDCVYNQKYEQFETIANDIIDALHSLYSVANDIKEEIPYISTQVSCENLFYSINNIIRLVRVRSDRALSKIEFELIPLLQEFYYDFYFFTCVFGDKEREKKHYTEEFIKMGANSYIDESIKTGKYKYDMSIYILAYNKLEYTKQCVESIIKYTPNNINYELFFLNNGSSDGTQEYFESFKCNKEINLLKNSFSDIRAVRRICEGRYVLSISNDVIVTENYLNNLIKCIESDPKIAMVVPTTPNVSNLQSIPAQYSTLEEMHAFAKANNVSNPTHWEERVRLCNPLTFYRSDVFLSSGGVGAIDKYFVFSEFGDDALALRLRRAGYKMILAKDCYCYHFGSVTLKEAQIKENTLKKSRRLFIERYGVDAWSTGFCYDPKLMGALTLKLTRRVNILGINSGFGSNPLKIKTLHKEAGNQDADLFFVTDDERYVTDMQTYSDNVKYVNDVTVDVYDDISFDFILLEGNVEKVICLPDNFDKIKNKLTKGGILAICATNDKEIKILSKLNADETITGHNCRWLLWYFKD